MASSPGARPPSASRPGREHLAADIWPWGGRGGVADIWPWRAITKAFRCIRRRPGRWASKRPSAHGGRRATRRRRARTANMRAVVCRACLACGRRRWPPSAVPLPAAAAAGQQRHADPPHGERGPGLHWHDQWLAELGVPSPVQEPPAEAGRISRLQILGEGLAASSDGSYLAEASCICRRPGGYRGWQISGRDMCRTRSC